jgi:molecular chaperone HtpG
MKKFKAESQRVLNLMINSIYTHKEIFLRELLSNANDALDKLYYKSLQENLSFTKDDFAITIEIDKKNRTLKVIDNGIGMTAKELEDNLGVIAKSGSLEFKEKLENAEDINIIGQFGVGFYSAFMVSDKVEVLSKAYGESKAYLWSSTGAEGYTVKEAEKEGWGTEITMYLKKSAENENYDEFLSEYRIKELVKKYSDYIRYPIKMDVEKTRAKKDDDKKFETYTETETLNSMVPLWKRNKSEITQEEYQRFYTDTFFDYEKPLKVIHTSAEGAAINFNAILFIPSKAPFNYYTKNYEKGLRLYTNGVLITEKCADLLPDYFGFVKGLVDSELTLNISRETVQHNHQLKKIAANIEKKISDTLFAMLENERESYQEFFKEFGIQIKYGIYENWGVNKDKLKDLIIFHSVKQDKYITLKEYVQGMGENQKYIYYANGSSIDSIKVLPQAEKVLECGYDLLCLIDDIDEFALKMLGEYDKKEFRSISGKDLGLDEESAVTETEADKKILEYIAEVLKDKVSKVKLSGRLKSHPVCLTSEGEFSIEMEKVFSNLPNTQGLKAQKVLEINANHPIYEKIKKVFDEDKESVKDYAKILLTQAQLIEGLPIENPSEYSDLVCRKLSL